MASYHFSEKIMINKPAEVIFDYTQNYSKRLDWDTFLKQAELINGATEADKGVRAWCVARNGIGMETKYVTYNRPRTTAVKMTRGPYMFSSFAGSWKFSTLEPDRSKVTFFYTYRLRFPFTLVGGLIKSNLRGNVRQRLRDLKKCVEGA
ncbi:type II toxin-antitoxin system RatA family toxin [Mucilaginibacter psychrotolerans]|uniref:SRPBCC family protein n=1 Tax=Mucilaginibacter psychrotolerans TaxID=1524096 RepID=A0A4Y8SLG2_9SPHI|nr:SRPBCC family protein [Mucilaginibacter psychrotolerans]TFF39264.1 SRPBCC family protein [Mucilaginibacter psychrotolerans]